MSIGPDPITGALTVIEEDHRIIHDGRAYTCHHTAELKKNETLDIVIRVPVTCQAHLRGWQFWCQRNKELEVTLYEGAQESGGMFLPMHNNSRGGPLPRSTLAVDPTVTDYGLAIDAMPVREVPSEFVLGSEWVLASSTSYVFHILNPNGKSRATARLFWYEPNAYAGGFQV